MENFIFLKMSQMVIFMFWHVTIYGCVFFVFSLDLTSNLLLANDDGFKKHLLGFFKGLLKICYVF